MSEIETDTNALSTTLENIFHCKSHEEELSLLTKAHKALSIVEENNEAPNENVEHDETGNTVDNSSPLASSICQTLSESEIEKFVIYTFVRRYGWSEGVKMRIADSSIILMTDVSEVKTVTRSNKDNLDKRLDVIIKWLSAQSVCPELMKSYLKLVNEASSLPIVRNRSVVHVFSWLQTSTSQINDESVFPLVCDFLVVTLTDVWSAIRKVSSSRLGGILDTLTEANLECLWSKLAKVIDDETCSWQTTDGAILGISATIQHLHSNKGKTSSNHKEIPAFVKRDFLEVVFKVISHSQLPIRESAVKAVAAYIGLVETQECVEILEQSLSLLSDGTQPMVDKGFVDAYLAEGLLNVCQSVIKILSLDCLLPRWEKYFPIFLNNLSHPASSVRQSASCVFKLLVQKSCDNAAIFCQVLYILSEGWTPVLSETRNSGIQELSWQGREGRMFAYEIICSFLIKNHIKTMFSRRKQGSENLHPPTGTDNCQSSSTPPSQTSGASQTANSPLRSRVKLDMNGLSVIAQMRLHDKTRQKIEVLRHKQPVSPDFLNDQAPTQQNEAEKSCPSSRMLLTTILYQSAECLSDSQWELHRIAQQVLPCLAEVVRWFDSSLLEDIWQTHLTSDTSLASYMSLFLLKESLYHCIRLEPLVQNSMDHKFKTPDLIDSVRCILECVTRNTALYLPHAERLLSRLCFDRLSILAAEVIIMAHRLFEIDTSQKHSQSVLEFWKRLFVFAHPSSKITRDLLDSPTTDFSSPYKGYLSCCLVKPEGDSQCARQVEKVFVKTVCCHLQVYLSCLPWTDIAAYLPLLMYNIGLIIDDTQMCKTLLRCLGSQSRRIVDKVLTEESCNRQFCLRCIYFSLREAAGIVTMKTLDSQLLQKVLNVYLVMCQAIHPSRHLKMILRGICVRLNKTTRHLESMDLSPRPDTVMSLLWQESPMLLNTMEGDSAEVDEEEDDIFAGGDLPAFYSECLSLNVSNSSGQFLPGRPRALSTQSEGGEVGETEGEQDGDESDDWDSWSDEEQDDGAINEMFSIFLRNLKQFLGQDAASIFDGEVRCLEADEEIIVHRLTSTGF